MIQYLYMQITIYVYLYIYIYKKNRNSYRYRLPRWQKWRDSFHDFGQTSAGGFGDLRPGTRPRRPRRCEMDGDLHPKMGMVEMEIGWLLMITHDCSWLLMIALLVDSIGWFYWLILRWYWLYMVILWISCQYCPQPMSGLLRWWRKWVQPGGWVGWVGWVTWVVWHKWLASWPYT